MPRKDEEGLRIWQFRTTSFWQGLRDGIGRWTRQGLRNERGALLVEMVVVVAVFTMLGTTVLTSVQTAHLADRKFERDSTAENLIRNQLAYVQEQDYIQPGGLSYGAYYDDPGFTGEVPAGYSVATEIEHFDEFNPVPSISRVGITVHYGGDAIEEIWTVRSD